MVSYGKTTYRKLFQSVAFPMKKDTALASLGMEAVIVWILEGEREICERLSVHEEYKLRLLEGQSEYPVQDRPVITAITNATPMVASSVAHGLIAGDGIFSTGVIGISANGRFFVGTVPDANSYQLKHGAYISGASNENPITITTDIPHGLTVGLSVTVSGVLGNTAANGTWTSVSSGPTGLVIVTDTTFTVPVVGNGDYTSGGIVTWNTIGDGAYVSGGRYWKDTEIPTFLRRSRVARREFSSSVRTLEFVGIDQVLGAEHRYEFGSFTGYGAPSIGGFWRRDGKKYLKVYPGSIGNEYIDIYGEMEIVPESYYDDTETTTLILGNEHQEVLKCFLRAKLYEWLGETERSMIEMQYFERAIESVIQNRPMNTVMSLEYY